MEDVPVRITLCCGLLLGLCCLMGGLPASAGETYMQDGEEQLVKDGVLGTVNVLRELDVKTWSNRVTVTSNVEGRNGTKPEDTIDGSGNLFVPQLDATKPFMLAYTLPGLRTVSSLAISWWRDGDAPDTVRLEGSSDGGVTWSQLFKSQAREGSIKFLKCFKPAKVNALRLTQEGPRKAQCKTKEVFVYAEPDVPLPLFGGKDTGAFSFTRELWYRRKATLFSSPMDNDVWTAPWGGRSWPHAPFQSGIGTDHEGWWGLGPVDTGRDKECVGKHIFFRLDLEKAYPMNFGLIGCSEEHSERNLAAQCRAEFYTANGNLDPAKLTGCSTKDLTGQGWVLQKTWDKDGNRCKSFLLEHPGAYNQILLVWENKGYNTPNCWGHLEMFGVDKPDAGGAPKNPKQ